MSAQADRPGKKTGSDFTLALSVDKVTNIANAGRGIPGMALHMRIGIRRVASSFPPVSVVTLPPWFELGWPALLRAAVECCA